MGVNNQKHIVKTAIMVIICVVCIMVDPSFASEQEYQVLILNSYHPNFTWTKEQTQGIIKEIKSSDLSDQTKIYIEYMNWKDFPTESNLKNLYRTYQERYKNIKLDLIITTDDAALDFALGNRADLFSNAPIVFTGINEQGELDLIDNQSNVTGVLEVIKIEGTLDMILKINPRLEKLYIIHDQTESGKSAYTVLEGMVKSSYKHITPISISNMTHEKLTRQICQIEEDSAILIASYYTDLMNEPIEVEKFCQIVSDSSNVPVFHTHSLTMGYGNMGGSMLSGFLQGEKAGQLALRILKGEKADQLPIIKEELGEMTFDYNQLERFQVPVSHIPQGAKIINKPFNNLYPGNPKGKKRPTR